MKLQVPITRAHPSIYNPPSQGVSDTGGLRLRDFPYQNKPKNISQTWASFLQLFSTGVESFTTAVFRGRIIIHLDYNPNGIAVPNTHEHTHKQMTRIQNKTVESKNHRNSHNSKNYVITMNSKNQ
ncbi:Uncharacterized protein Fot_50515 [Forsythia ovata]|uniref:Uncharacterized protein n=1 Tax=Forsythia ovata TaxID=205694 RepID=A0ABD1Q1A1_9LAMI